MARRMGAVDHRSPGRAQMWDLCRLLQFRACFGVASRPLMSMFDGTSLVTATPWSEAVVWQRYPKDWFAGWENEMQRSHTDTWPPGSATISALCATNGSTARKLVNKIRVLHLSQKQTEAN